MVRNEDSIKLHRKRAFVALEAFELPAHDLFAVFPAEGHAVLLDVLPFLVFALKLDGTVRIVVDANSEFVARANAARLFPEGGVKRVVEIQAPNQVFAAAERGVVVLFEARLDARGEQLVLPFGDDVFQFVPVLLAGQLSIIRHLPPCLPVLIRGRRCSSSPSR
ncbi:hypothetical protein SDC9_174463 [bioreactor metagenome]|uniref:Uncharacterized protein n=1 Tax=bioreactor metagenome TaxID=1076179 RepID=A0A645GLE1_9ZZZZ